MSLGGTSQWCLDLISKIGETHLSPIKHPLALPAPATLPFLLAEYNWGEGAL